MKHTGFIKLAHFPNFTFLRLLTSPIFHLIIRISIRTYSNTLWGGGPGHRRRLRSSLRPPTPTRPLLTISKTEPKQWRSSTDLFLLCELSITVQDKIENNKGDVSQPIRRLLARLAIAVPGWKIQPSASMMTGVTILIKMLINLAMVMLNIAVARH